MVAFHALAAALVVLAADKVPEPPSGPNPFLVQAKDLYSKLEFEKCLKRVAQAQQWRSNPKELLEIELYAGLCHFNLGQKPDAEERFKTALRIDPGADLPPYTTPRAVELFAKIKKSMKPPKDKEKEKEAEKEREKEKERQTAELLEAPPVEKEKPEVKKDPEPPPKEKEKVSDAPVAKKLVPEQVEQELPQPVKQSFVAQKVPAIALTGVAAVGLGLGIGFGASSKEFENKARNAEFESDFFKNKREAEGRAVVANISYGTAAAAAVVAVVLWVTNN